MARVYRARCLRDTVQDNPYQYFKAGVEYLIPEDSPVARHFQPLEELPKKEAERVVEEGEITKPVELDREGQPKTRTSRTKTYHGPGYAERE